MRLFLILPFFYSAFLAAAPFQLQEVNSAYKDVELERLWGSIKNINEPSLQDYLLIEEYLKYGRREYLDEFFNIAYLLRCVGEEKVDRSKAFSNRILQRMMLVGPNKEMPTFQRVCLGGSSPSDLSRCIIFYTSYNISPHPFDEQPLYSEKMLEVIRELEEENYKGHVLFRIGGYPLTERGGLHLAHVPYSFKVLALIEASILGYENVLWLDSSIHPTNDLSIVFNTLEKDGVFLLGNGTPLSWEYENGLLSDASLAYSTLSPENLFDIEQIWAAIIGVSFKKRKVHNLIQEWYRLTAEVYPAMTLYPEQFILSVAAWRAKCKPTGSFGTYTNFRTHVPSRPVHDQGKPFWFDKG
jgi:hypothetical protein